MDKEKIKQNKKDRRARKIRAKISGTSKRPRLSVFRSNKGMYLQLIDDKKGRTLVSAHSSEINPSTSLGQRKKDTAAGSAEGKKVAIAFELGKLIAKKAIDKKIKTIVFDRGGYKYHGRVKAIADGAREGGLEF